MEKSYVGMMNCFVCNKPKAIALDKRLRNILPHSAVYDKEPCDKCKEYMKKGVIIISVKDGETNKDNPYRTGGWWVVREEAIKKFPINNTLKNDILKKKVLFMEDEVCKRFGLNLPFGELNPKY